MSDDERIQQVYQFDIDATALARARAGITSAKKYVEDLTASIKAQPVIFDSSGKSLIEMANSAKVATSNLNDLEDAYSAAANAATKLVDTREKIVKTETTGSSQKLFSAGAQIAGALGGGGAVGQAISTAGGVTDAIRELPKLTDAVKGLPPSALAAGGATAGLVLAINAYAHAQEQAKQAAMAELDARQRALTLLQSSNQEEIQNRINQLAKQKDINEKIAADTNQLFQNIKDETLKQLGPAAAAAEYYASSVGQAAGSYQAARDAAEKATQTVSSTSTELDLLQKASGLTAQTTADLAAKEADLNKARTEGQYITSDIQSHLSAQLELQKLITTGTTEGLRSRLAGLQTEAELVDQAADAAREKQKSFAVESQQYKDLTTLINQLVQRSNDLKVTFNDLNQGFLVAAIQTREEADAFKKSNEDKISASKKYNEDVIKIEEQSAEARAKAIGNYNDALVKAAETAADAAAAALDKLKDSRSRLAQNLVDADATAQTKLEQDKLDAAIKRQQEEVRSAREHARTLDQIRKDGQKSEQQAIDDRDFMALFQIRQDTKDKMDAENQRYVQEQQDRQEAYAVEDKQREDAFAREREARMIKYKKDLADAQTQYNKELAIAADNKAKAIRLATQARDNELNLLQSKLTTDLRLKAQAWEIELKNAQLSGQQRIAVEQQINDALLAQANARLNASRASSAFSAAAGNNTAPSSSGRVSPTKDFNSSSSIGGGGKAVTINGPLVAPTINAGNASASQLNNMQNMIFQGALEALQVVTGVQVVK